MQSCFTRTMPLLALSVWLSLATWSSAVDDPRGDWQFMRSVAPKHYVCGWTAQPPAIDGNTDEALWQTATWTDDFVDIEGEVKPKPTWRTRAALLWDEQNLYIAAEIEEPHVWGTLTEHDAVIFHDNDFEVFIDPDGDNHAYYELELNALNTTWDLFLPKPYKDGGKADNGLELKGLRTAVKITGTLNDASDRDKGWSVEIAIPWTALQHQGHKSTPPVAGDQWRIDFSRVEWDHEIVAGQYRKLPGKKEHNWVWSPPGIIDMHRPERWGYVQFSKAGSGAEAFRVDPGESARELLMELYHRQKTFHRQHGRWMTSLDEFAWTPAAQLPGSLKLQATQAGFEASVEEPDSGPATQVWHVRHDSRLWRTAKNVQIEAALERAGGNRGHLERALRAVAAEQREGMEFLIVNMPERDLRELTADFLLDNVQGAYRAWREAPWQQAIPREIFLNNVLPYANINERRDTWRGDFRERFLPLVRAAKTPSEAAALLNQQLFPTVKVKYSTQRRKADQSPYESIKSGLASCTGLSVLLIDACRAVGVPARFVGTPLWSDRSGNHSWVEIFDDGWHFTGAAEPAGMALDKAWFIDRASKAQRDDPLHAIYAVSFQKTPISFPLVWDRSIEYINAVNVTDRYVALTVKPPAGTTKIMFRVLDASTGRRVAANVKVTNLQSQAKLLDSMANDERFDANDHLAAYLPLGSELEVTARAGQAEVSRRIRVTPEETLVTLTLGVTALEPGKPGDSR